MKPLPHIEQTPKNEKDWLAALLGLARYLRSPKGCPWDREQTTLSFAQFLCGEAEELREAAEKGDNDHIAEEFGDTLFCALMTAAVAEDEGRFVLHEALERAHEKMIRRHGHIFGEHDAQNAADAVKVWEQIKAEEKRQREDPQQDR